MKHKIKSLLKKLNFRSSVALTWSVSPRLTVVTLLLMVLENLSWLGSLYMIKKLVDVVARGAYAQQQDDLIRTIIASGIISIAYACTKSLSGYYSEILAARVNHVVDKRIHAHTLGLDYSFYENPEYLDILKRAREAGNDKPYATVSSLFEIVKQSVMIASVGFVLISIDWMLLPLLALFVLPILIGRILFSNRRYDLYIRNTSREREAHYLSSLLTGDTYAKEVRTFSLGKYLLTKYSVIRDHLINEELTLSRKRTGNELLTTGLSTAAFFGITAYIVFGTLSGKTSVGDIALFLVIFPQSFSIMQSLVAAITRLYQNNMYVAHIFELFSLQSKIENKVSLAAPREGSKAGLVLENVSFRYPHGDETVLSNISMQIPPGKIIALVGMNGAGKTTLIKLLCKLYEPDSGTVFFGGEDIRQYSAEQYRRQVSVVFQDFIRYNFSVKENIWFGDISSEPSPEEIRKAAANAGADSFIENFPEKYDTTLGRLFDNGHEISIGQWQKIAIARAFYGNSSLVILDEATSALDAIAETELFDSFRSRIGNRSALVISHRLSTIRHADYIYVMSDRQIAESGTHEELLALHGQYAALYKNSTDETPKTTLSTI